TGVANSGLIIGPSAAVAVDALMVPSMTKRLVTAIKKTTRKPVAQLINTHHHLDHTGGNRFFRGATIVATEKCRAALAPGFPPVPLLKRFMPKFAAEFPKLQVVLPTVTFEDRMVLHDGEREIQLWHPGFAAHTVGDAAAGLPAEAAAADIKLGVYASWSDAERILSNVMRCYQEFRDELDQPMDLPRMLAGMERLRGAASGHACV